MENKHGQELEGKIEELEGKHFDIGIAGVWYGTNYGSVLTYYALYRTLTKLGYSVLMIDKLRKVENDWELNEKIHSRVFAAKHYQQIAPALRADEMKLLNRYCDTFLMGCDQVWNYGIARNFGLNNYFDYVAEDKRKLSYASSFGHDVSFTPVEMMPIVTKLFHRFDAISVREADAVRVLKDEFGIEGTQVVDPVFLLDKEEYQEILKDSNARETEKFLLSYILDPTPEIREALLYAAKKKNLKLINMIDGRGDRKKNIEILNLPNIVENLDAPTWLWYMEHAEFVITDSCHGASFSLIFERPFIAIANKRRGVSRFESLVDMLAVRDRYIHDVGRIQREEKLLSDVDYARINNIFAMERERSLNWLKSALSMEKKQPITVKDCVSKKECCGCGACFQACPSDAIRMDYDEEGILYPLVDEEKCIRCGKCVRVCPALHPYDKNKKEPECYAAFADDEVRAVSSSGGIFSMVAEQALQEGGAVCGAMFDEQFRLSQKVIYCREELPKLRSSKYIQSNTGHTFQEIKKVLDDGKPALYVGTPCLVAGLRGYLGKEYEQLFTIDLLCHGGPSPVSFQKYLQEVHGKKEIAYVGFRDKDHFEWQINGTGMTVKYKDGGSYRRAKSEDLYYRAFTPSLMVRPQCQVCNYAKLPRLGDFTLGDFWGVEKYYPELTDGKGTSIVSVNSEKGAIMLGKIKPKLKLLEKIDINHILTHGQPYAKPYKNNPRRYRFLRMARDCSFRKSLECCEQNRFDFALLGMNGDSHGEILGYYALYQAIAGRNYSVLMVKRPREWDEEITPLKYRLTSFANRHYPAVSTHERVERLPMLQKTCGGYISDNAAAYEKYLGESKYFVDTDKAICGLDKEFLLGRQDYERLIIYAECEAPKQYIAYDCRGIQSGMEDKILQYAREHSLSVVQLAEDRTAENWLYLIQHAQCVVSNRRDVINFAVIFEKKLIIPQLGLQESVKRYILDIGLKDSLLGEAEDMSGKLASLPNTDYGNVYAVLDKRCACAQKELNKSLKSVYRNIQHRDNPLSGRVKRNSIRILKRVLPPTVKEQVKKILGK